MDMPKPSEAHRKLQKLVGRWKGEERLSPSPWDPKGGTAVGRIENRPALDGFVVVQDYEQERDGAVGFRGHGVFSWDPTKKRYLLHWFDSMGMPPNEFVGDFERDVLTVTGASSQGQSRAVFDVSKPGRYSFRMDVSGDGKEWQTFMEGKYSKES
ncbi:MAG: DUF1579 family protein [Candidatus Methylomirabilis sp.]